jgi:dihydroorotate dehydrogenase (NAD+) catalytic subunit
MDLSVKIGSLTLKNPVTVASGTAGYGEDLSEYIDISKLGAIFTKGLSLEPRLGNTGNRIIEVPAGLMNSIGLENVGIKKFMNDKVPFLKKSNAVIIPNVAGHSVEENVELCRILSEIKEVSAIELNVSCPNVNEGCITFGKDPVMLRSLTEKVRSVTKCPLIVKLTPNVGDIAECAQAAKDGGADAVSAVNTYQGLKIDIKKRKPHFNNIFAGVSGPAIRPLALRAVYEIRSRVDIPIIGMGGIMTAEDAIEFILAGASAISIGSGNMVDPTLSLSVLFGIEEWCAAHNVKRISEIIGAAHK